MQSEKMNSQIVIYKTENGETKLDVRFDGDTVWLTQKLLSALFNVGVPAINKHLKNIFEEGELDEKSVISILETTANDGKVYKVNYYNLDTVIAVGYRVNSKSATSFRVWATDKLKEYIVKGFVLDDERLKNPDLPFDYFENLTERIADIRTSEKRFYRKITDIYATSIDYDPTNDSSILFFKTVQNKVHYAITGSTAAEIIVNRIDENKDKMGLTYTRNIKPAKDEVLIAKNYYSKEELEQLNNLVEQYLVFAQGQAMRRVPMKMNDWIEKLHGFLNLNDRDILKNAGKISHEIMIEVVDKKFEEYKNIASKKNIDFDDRVTKILEQVKSNKKVIKDKK
jgi:hypothetical protein